MLLENISIIIPAYEGEKELGYLLADLKNLRAEIMVSSENTRAKSLNCGAAKASREYLWFLHADSRVSADNLNYLSQAIKKNPDALHYFDLVFDRGGIMSVNAWGANIRSRLFGTPFGDQGFCISSSRFSLIGGYPENLDYGEDLMFVWRARQAGLKLSRIASKLKTSARKYDKQGWLKLILLYQWRWIYMSVPELYRLLRVEK